MRDELNKRYIGGDAFEASAILEEVIKFHERTLDALGLGKHQNRKNDSCLEGYLHVGPIIDKHDIQEEGRAEGRAGADPLRERPLGVVVAWRNVLGDKIRFLPEIFVIPTMPLPNLVSMWYCGGVLSNIPSYKMLRTCNVSHLKHGKCKLSQIKKLMGHVKRAARIINKTHCVHNDCTAEHKFSLYNTVKHLFLFDSIRVGKRRRYESISWKTYYNNLSLLS